MAQIIAFPTSRKTPAAHVEIAASTNVAAEVHRPLPQAGTTVQHPVKVQAAATSRSTREDEAPALHDLVAQMRADSQELMRSLVEVQTAVRQLADADLPGQARALLQEALGDTRATAAR